jgi:hypothetical protein
MGKKRNVLVQKSYSALGAIIGLMAFICKKIGSYNIGMKNAVIAKSKKGVVTGPRFTRLPLEQVKSSALRDY